MNILSERSPNGQRMLSDMPFLCHLSRKKAICHLIAIFLTLWQKLPPYFCHLRTSGLPSVISSQKWRDLFCAKDDDEKKKEDTKKQREELKKKKEEDKKKKEEDKKKQEELKSLAKKSKVVKRRKKKISESESSDIPRMSLTSTSCYWIISINQSPH